MNLRTNIRIVSLSDNGFPATEEAPVVGDLYLTPSITDPEMYDQWIWAGADLEWQKIGIDRAFDDEKELRAKRVRNVQQYFKKKKERYMMTMMGRLSDALDEVGTAFKEMKDEQD